MPVLVLSTFLLVVLLDMATRRSRKHILIEQFGYSLFALRDRLRQSAADGKIEMDLWFDIVDSSITTAIMAAEKMSLLHLMAVNRVTPVNRRKELVSTLNKALASRPHLRTIVDDFRKILWTFVCARNPILATCWRSGGSGAANTADKTSRRKVLDAVYVSREFSTVPDLAPCGV